MILLTTCLILNVHNSVLTLNVYLCTYFTQIQPPVTSSCRSHSLWAPDSLNHKHVFVLFCLVKKMRLKKHTQRKTYFLYQYYTCFVLSAEFCVCCAHYFIKHTSELSSVKRFINIFVKIKNVCIIQPLRVKLS